MKPFKKRILSLDMGNHSYKIMEAVRKPDLHIQRFSTYTPEEIHDKGAFAKELRKLRCLSRDVVMSFHHKSLVIREFKLPEKDSLQLHKYIHEEMLQYQEDFKEEYDYDYLIVPECDKTGGSIATTAAVAKRINRQYIDRAIHMGFKLKAVDIQINSVLRVLLGLIERCKELSPSSAYLLLDMGYDNTTIAITYLGRVYAPKVISRGCKSLDSKLKYGSKEAAASLSEYLFPIIYNCNTMIENFTHSFAGIPLQQGFLYGGGVRLPGVIPYLENNIALSISDIDSFREYFPEIPAGCDLNLFVNCFGSLLRKDHAV